MTKKIRSKEIGSGLSSGELSKPSFSKLGSIVP